MFKLSGKYGSAIVFADDVEETAYSQIIQLVNHPVAKDAHIRIMPDVHAGAGCVIGYTAKLNNIVVPNLIGVDIGCGVLAFYFKRLRLDDRDFQRIDGIIKNNIPSGTRIRKTLSKYIYRVCGEYLDIDFYKFEKTLRRTAERTNQDINYALNSIGSLGSGNHFIEVDKTADGVYFTVHSGSRKFGLNIANYYQRLAKKYINKNEVKSGMEFLQDEDAKRYMGDMRTAQIYARINRYAILYTIIDNFFSDEQDGIIESVHNYINFEDGMVRKGAISAHRNEKVAIPLNMASGLIIGEGLGSKDWNYSAPHGAGRKMSRKQAKKLLLLGEFEDKMQGIYSSCIGERTIDESPMAYKDTGYILKYLKETVKIIEMAKPIYNFKAG